MLQYQKSLRYFLYIAILLLLLQGWLQASPVGAVPSFDDTVSRIYGADRYKTAAAISQSGWNTSDTVILARGCDFPDSLAGVPLAYQLDAPILLTPAHTLSADAKAEIKRLGATRVIILGGAAAVSDQVEAALDWLTVERIGGADRYETAGLIAGRLAEERGTSTGTAVIANGLNFPDALAAASYAAVNGYPILLTGLDRLPKHTLAVIPELNLTGAVIAGGPGVIGSAVKAELTGLGLTVERVCGEDRFETAVALAEYFTPDGNHYYVSTGDNFPDVLAGAVLAGKQGRGILLVRGDRVPVNSAVEKFLASCGTQRITILGGEPAVSNRVAMRLYEVIQGLTPPPAEALEPPQNLSITHRVVNGNLYGLDYLKNNVWLTAAPGFLAQGDYVMDRYHFFLMKSGEPEYRGYYYYLEHIPYSILPLYSPADPQITASSLSQRAAQLKPDSPFKNLGPAFIQAQETWGINALYLMAHAALESTWGTSFYAQDRHNLFGYGAIDSNPDNAYAFRSKEECILWVAGIIRRSYLSEGGRFHRGSHLAGMNFYYASDPMWGVKIARAMESIYPPGAYNAVEKLFAQGCVNTGGLNLRKGPGTGFDIIGTLAHGTPVTILGMSIVNQNSYWFKVNSPLGEGWTYGEYISLESSPQGSYFLFDWYKDNSKTLNVRSGPGMNYGIKDSISFGQKVSIEEVRSCGDRVWFKVNYPGSSGESWVAADYIIVDW